MKRILVVGDYIEDHYMWCKATRLCPEAPAPVIVVESNEVRAGGAGNVAGNIKSLSENGMTCFLLTGSTSVKTRYFVGNHLLFRVDNDRKSASTQWKLCDTAKRIIEADDYGAIVIADYDKGGVGNLLAQELICNYQLPVFVDAKCPNPDEKYRDAFCIFPNESEHPKLDVSNFRHIVRKLGPKGCMVDGEMVPTKEQPVFDVTGAGDVFIAAFVLKFMEYTHLLTLISDDQFMDCARFANRAAGVSVRFIGTHAVTRKELESNYEHEQSNAVGA